MVSLCPARRSNSPPMFLNTDCIAAAESSRTSAALVPAPSHKADSSRADAAARANVLIAAVMILLPRPVGKEIAPGGLSGDPLLFRHACEKTHSRPRLGGRALFRGAGTPRHALGNGARSARQPCDRGAAGRGPRGGGGTPVVRSPRRRLRAHGGRQGRARRGARHGRGGALGAAPARRRHRAQRPRAPRHRPGAGRAVSHRPPARVSCALSGDRSRNHRRLARREPGATRGGPGAALRLAQGQRSDRAPRRDHRLRPLCGARLSRQDRCRAPPAFIGFDHESDYIAEAAWLAQQFGERRFSLRTNSQTTQAAAARAGFGIALLPRYLAAADPDLVPVSLANRLPEREVWLIIRRDLRNVPRVRAVADYLVAVFRRDA